MPGCRPSSHAFRPPRSPRRAAPLRCTRSSTTAIVAAPDSGQSVPSSAPAINLNEPDMQKHTVEVRIGRDEDDRWWVVVILDAKDNEAVWRGSYEDEKAAKKEGLALA